MTINKVASPLLSLPEPKSFVQQQNAARHEKQNLLNDPRRKNGRSSTIARLELTGWRKLQNGRPNDGLVLWLLRAPSADPAATVAQIKAIGEELQELQKVAAVNGIACGDVVAALGAAPVAQQNKIPLYPADKSFLEGTAAAEHIVPGGVSVVIPAPGQEPPPDPSLARGPGICAKLLQAPHYEKSWKSYVQQYPGYADRIKGHLYECRRMQLLPKQPAPGVNLGARAFETALNRSRRGIAVLPDHYEDLFIHAKIDDNKL